MQSSAPQGALRRPFRDLSNLAGVLLPAVLMLSACGGAAAPASSSAAAAAGKPAVSAAVSPAAATAASPQAAQTSGQTAAAGWDQVVASARQEGTVFLGIPPGPQYQPAITAAFGKAYPGIKVETANLVGATFSARIAQERAAGQYTFDAWIGGAGVDIYNLVHDGVFDPLKPEIMLPDVLDDSKWLGGSFDGRFGDLTKKFSFNFGASQTEAAVVNRDFIPESTLSKFDDLWKPEFKGKIVWQDPRQSGSGVNVAAIVLKVYGEQKLRDLWTTQQVTIATDERQMANWVAQGTHPIGVGLVRNRGLDLLKEQGVGKNILSVFFSIPLSAPAAHSLLAINRPPHPNARKLMLNWILTQDGQTVLSKAVSTNSARLDVPIVDPNTEVPRDKETLDSQAEAFAPLRVQANKLATEIFK